ncbi:MAG: tetratricopeptide repeat protein [Desulfobacteraceae bacterium]
MKRGFFVLVLMSFLCGCTGPDWLSLEKEGDRAFENNAYKKAIGFWLKAVEKNPDEPPAKLYEKIGKTYLKLSRVGPAERFFKKALELHPENSRILKQIARILVIKGEYASAFKKMDRIGDTLQKDTDYYLLYGDMYMVSKEYAKAEAMYRKGFDENRESIRARLKLALCLKKTGQEDEADHLVAMIDQHRVIDPLLFLLLSDYYLVSGQMAESEKFLLQAVNTYPESLLLKKRLARFYLQTGQESKALKLLVRLEKSYPEEYGFKLLLADLYLSGLHMEKAGMMLDKAGKTAGSPMADYHLLKGKYLLFKGQNARAVSHFKTVISENPALALARYLLGVAYFSGGQTKLAEKSFVNALMLEPEHMDSLVALGYLLYQNREFALALDYTEKALAVERTNPRAIRAKGLCLLGQRRFEEALSELAKGAYMNPDAASLFFYATALEKVNKLSQAAKVYKQAMQMNPGGRDVTAGYLRLMVKLGNSSGAMAEAEKILEKKPEDPFLYYVAADLAYRIEQYDKSAQYLETALKLDDPPGYIFSLLAAVYRRTGQWDRAVDLLTRCTSVNPQYGKGWNDLAGLYVERDSVQSALETLNRAIEHMPDSGEIAGNLAWLLLESGTELDRALDLARRAYEKLPENGSIADTLGWAYYHKKAYSQAAWMFETAEELAPDKAIVKYHRAMLNYRQGRISAAKSLFGKALEYDHDLSGKTVDHIHEILGRLQEHENGSQFDIDDIFDTDGSMDQQENHDEDMEILKPDWSGFYGSK